MCLKNKRAEKERIFLLDLKDLSKECLLQAILKGNILTPGFDVVRGIAILDFAMEGELDSFVRNYLEEYGE